MAFSLSCQAAEKKIVGYFAGWSRHYAVADIPADKLTHINYAFATIHNGEITVPRGKEHIKQLRQLREKHKHLRLLISVGGWSGSAGFSDAALTPDSRQKFARSCARFVATSAFDGVDIDWEYPATRGHANATTRPEDTKNFTLLLAELRRQLDQLADSFNRPYLLTIAAPAGGQAKRIELDRIHAHLDFINLMTYDFAGPWSKRTGINSPLFGAMSIDSAAKLYLAAGVPRAKLVVGVPFYGRAWGGVRDENHGLDQPHDGKPPRPVGDGPAWTYRSLAENYISKIGTRHWHQQASSPWLFDPAVGLMISYDDPESIALKAKYVRDNNLAGVMIWELSQDDENSSLLDAIHQGLKVAAAPQ